MSLCKYLSIPANNKYTVPNQDQKLTGFPTLHPGEPPIGCNPALSPGRISSVIVSISKLLTQPRFVTQPRRDDETPDQTPEEFSILLQKAVTDDAL